MGNNEATGDLKNMFYSKEKFADQLNAIAEEIRCGSIAADGNKWSVPEEFSAKIKMKEKRGRLKIKISFDWTTLDDHNQETRKKIDDWHNSMKSIKKEMSRSFKALVKNVTNNQMPTAAEVQELVDISKAFAEISGPEMDDAMEEYMGHLNILVKSVEEQKFEQVTHEVNDLRLCMKSCHREFK